MEKLWQLNWLFLQLGITSFGGPAAHIAMMEREVVEKRNWLDRTQFLDLLGATNLIPGPNSTELAIHLGYDYAGWAGLVVAGVSFILPAFVITLAFAITYQQFNTLPAFTALLYGIKPVVVAIIFDASWRLGKKAVKNRFLAILAIAVGVAAFLGVNEVIALLAGGLAGLAWQVRFGQAALVLPLLATLPQPAVPLSLTQLGWVFLKIGSVLFGGGYILFALLEAELVGGYGWLTKQQLLDAIAVGQFTPGPILSTATFIGYVLAGWPGAVVATLGIFLPSFVLVAITNPIIPKLRNWSWTTAFLDAVNASATALIFVVALKLSLETFFNPMDWLVSGLFLAAVVSLWKFQLTSPALVLTGALLGATYKLLFP